MNTITYRIAEEADIDYVVEARLQFLTELDGPQTPELVQELKLSLSAYFQKALNKTYFCWLAVSGNELAGTGCLVLREQAGGFRNPSGKMGYVMSMYTRPAYRRKGISSAILDLLIATGREKGIRAFELHATSAGEAVYKKYGFKIHNESTYRIFYH